MYVCMYVRQQIDQRPFDLFFLVLGRNFNSDKSSGSSAISSVSYAKISVKQIHRIEKLSTSFDKVSHEISELCLVEMTIGK